MDERIAQRFAVLHQMYEIAGGDPDYIIKKVNEIAEPLGLSRQDVNIALNYLEREGLVHYRVDQDPSISHEGIKEVERMLREPNQPTKHFTSFNVIIANTIVGSHIQQGTTKIAQQTDKKS